MKTLFKPQVSSRPIQETFASANAGLIEANLNDAAPKALITLIAEGPGNSLHRHYYGRELLEKAVADGIFEGKPSFLNHPSKQDQTNRPERDVKDLAGWFENVHIVKKPVTEKGLPGMPVGYQRSFVVGTLNAESGNEASMNKLREAANYQQKYPEKPGYVGWSILGGGSSKPKDIDGEKWNNVEAFTGIDSIDMVTKAGAGGRLISLMEGQPRMFRLFGKRTAPTKSAVAEKARLDLAAHVVTALKESGTSPTADQTETIGEGLKLMAPQLMTPAFIRTLIHEAGIDIPDEKEDTLTEKLDVEGTLKTLVEAAGSMTDQDNDGIPDSEEAKKEAAKKEAAKKAKEAADKADAEAKEKKEAALPALVEQVRQLTERAVVAETENKALKEAHASSTRTLRESNARALMAKTTISAPKQAIFLDQVAELPITEQAAYVTKLEEAFGDKINEGGAPARGNANRGSATGARFTIDATR
jgi:hypothetical protein